MHLILRSQKPEAIERKDRAKSRSFPSCLPADWFEQFWRKYPNKVDPKGSKKKLVKALKDGTSFQTIMDGLDRYLTKTDDRPWCNPTTWINQARWDHRPAEVAPHGKAKTGGGIVTALKELGEHYDQERHLSDIPDRRMNVR